MPPRTNRAAAGALPECRASSRIARNPCWPPVAAPIRGRATRRTCSCNLRVWASERSASRCRPLNEPHRKESVDLGKYQKIFKKATKKNITKVGCSASHGAAFLHFTQESMSHTSASVFTDEMPKTCKPTTSKTVSNFRNCPGTMAPTRALKDETVAGQPIQSFTGIPVNMRQLSCLPAARLVKQRLW